MEWIFHPPQHLLPVLGQLLQLSSDGSACPAARSMKLMITNAKVLDSTIGPAVALDSLVRCQLAVRAAVGRMCYKKRQMAALVEAMVLEYKHKYKSRLEPAKMSTMTRQPMGRQCL